MAQNVERAKKRKEKYFVVRLTHFCHDSLHYCFYAALLSLRKNMHITHTRREWARHGINWDVKKREKKNRSKSLTHCRKRKKNLIDSNPFHSIRFDSIPKLNILGPTIFLSHFFCDNKEKFKSVGDTRPDGVGRFIESLNSFAREEKLLLSMAEWADWKKTEMKNTVMMTIDISEWSENFPLNSFFFIWKNYLTVIISRILYQIM